MSKGRIVITEGRTPFLCLAHAVHSIGGKDTADDDCTLCFPDRHLPPGVGNIDLVLFLMGGSSTDAKGLNY